MHSHSHALCPFKSSSGSFADSMSQADNRQEAREESKRRTDFQTSRETCTRVQTNVKRPARLTQSDGPPICEPFPSGLFVMLSPPFLRGVLCSLLPLCFSPSAPSGVFLCISLLDLVCVPLVFGGTQTRGKQNVSAVRTNAAYHCATAMFCDRRTKQSRATHTKHHETQECQRRRLTNNDS